MAEVRPKFLDYLDEGLRHHGFVIADADIAFAVSSQWSTRFNCGADISTDRSALARVAERRGAKLLQVALAGMDRRVPMLAMSEHMLAERVEWLTGRRVTAICPLGELEAAPAPAPAQSAKESEPPPYPCEARRRWFEERGLRDPLAADRRPSRPSPTTGYRAS